VLTKDRTFIFFLQNSATSACYWLDSGRNVRQSSVFDGMDQDLTIETPDAWKDMSLGFEKNADYQGFNRSFSFPAKLIDDAAYIVRALFNTPLGHGIETPITMTVLKYNDNPNPGDAQYTLYWTGRLDLFNLEDDVAEGVKVNMIEGGVMQVVKAMENIVFELPCDGSIPENIQVYMDGMYVEDTAYFDFIPMSGDLQPAITRIATSFQTDEDGDSFGVQLGVSSMNRHLPATFKHPIITPILPASQLQSGSKDLLPSVHLALPTGQFNLWVLRLPYRWNRWRRA
jgi:hypothetical protein